VTGDLRLDPYFTRWRLRPMRPPP